MKRFHSAWAVCLGCTLMLFVCGGLAINAFSVTQPYVLSCGGFTNTQTSMITSVRSLCYLLAVFASPLFYRLLGYRPGTVAACGITGGSFVAFGLSRTLFGFYAAGALAGIGAGLGSMVPATILITRWFHRKKGLALGLCSASTGLAMVVFSPILTAICETFSLKACFFMEAAFSFVCAALVFLLVRDTPEALGLTPYGAEAGAAPAKSRAPESPSSLPLPHRQLFALWLVTGLLGAVASPGPSHLMILYTTAGMAAHQAALAVSVFGLALMVGKCVYGMACDRFGGYRMGWLFGAILCAGLTLCTLAGSRNALLMFAAVVLYGAGVSLSTVGLSIWAQDFGGETQVGQLMRQFQTCYGIGSLLLSAMPGLIADRTGSYAGAYGVLLLSAAGSVLAVQILYHRRAQRALV